MDVPQRRAHRNTSTNNIRYLLIGCIGTRHRINKGVRWLTLQQLQQPVTGFGGGPDGRLTPLHLGSSKSDLLLA